MHHSSIKLIYTEAAGYDSPMITLNTLCSRSKSSNLDPSKTDIFMTFHYRIFYFQSNQTF